MEFNEFVPITSSNYVRLLDGTPYGLVVNRDREPIGVFIVLHGLEAFRQHCYIPDKTSGLYHSCIFSLLYKRIMLSLVEI